MRSGFATIAHRRASGVLCLLTAFATSRALADEPGDRPIAGRVVDVAGAPVANAKVWLVSPSPVHFGEIEEYSRDETDSDGRYELALPASWGQTPTSLRQELSVIAIAEGRVAALCFYRASDPPTSGLDLVLGGAATAHVRVLDPAGEPLAGAQVSVPSLAGDTIHTEFTQEQADAQSQVYDSTVVRTPYGFAVGKSLIPLPVEVQELLTTTTDTEGIATIAGISATEMGGLRIKTGEFGEQNVFLNFWTKAKPDEWPGTVALKPVGKIAGRVTAADLAAATDQTVSIQSMEPLADEPLYHTGTAVAVSDAEGRFAVPAIAVGGLRLRATYDSRLPFRPRPPGDAIVSEGETLDLVIPIEPAVRLFGQVVDAGTKRPIPLIALSIGHEDTIDRVAADDEGRFECFVPPGQVLIQPIAPEGYLPIEGEEVRNLLVNVPSQEAFETAPVMLRAAATLRGGLVLDDGTPAAGGEIIARWFGFDRHLGHKRLKETTLTADERGEFALAALDPQTDVRLTARLGDAIAVKTLTGAALSEPLTLRISADNAIPLAGRVLDDLGSPLAGAAIEIWHRPWQPPFLVAEPRKLFPSGETTLRTGEDGRFVTPKLEPDGDYRLTVRSGGVRTTESDWIDVTKLSDGALPDLTAARLHGTPGVIRDRQGNPLAGASVAVINDHGRTETTTDDEGRFEIEVAADVASFFVVRHPECRVAGELLVGPRDRVDLTLTRLDERPPALVSRPHRLAREERLRLAEPLVTAIRERLDSEAEESIKLRLYEALAAFDPDSVIERLADGSSLAGWNHAYVVRAIVLDLRYRDFDAAEELAGAATDTSIRATLACDLADALPAEGRDRKLALLAEGLVHARSVREPDHRIVCLALIAERLLDLGEREQAIPILREGEAQAAELPTTEFAGYARGAFAEELAQIDLPAALALTKDLEDTGEFDRHHGNIAHELAGIDPAGAERVLDLIPRQREGHTSQWDHFAIRVCYRMASGDLERAKRLAEAIEDPFSRAYALGVMADALAADDPDEALNLLRGAFAILDEADWIPASDLPLSALYAAAVAGCLLPTVEKIDAELVPEFLWHALSFQPSRTEDQSRRYRTIQAIAALAICAAPYDQAAAESLLDRLDPEERVSRDGLAALALVRPEQSVQVVQSIGDGRLQSLCLSSVVPQLVAKDKEYRRHVHHALGVWPIDVEGLFW